jgi:hypothetical protein
MPKAIGSLDLDYLERAAKCHRKADAAISPVARANYLIAESRWLAVADTYAKSEQTAYVAKGTYVSEQTLTGDIRVELCDVH